MDTEVKSGEEKSKQEENVSWSQFDPMLQHFGSISNSYRIDPGGELDPSSKLKQRSVKKNSGHCKLYVKYLDEELTETGLRNMFRRYGRVISAIICKPHKQLFAFVVMESVDRAMAAIYGLHEKPPHNLYVQFAMEKKSKPPRCTFSSVKESNWPEITPVAPEAITYPPLDPSQNILALLNNEIFEQFFKTRKCTSLELYNEFIKKISIPRIRNIEKDMIQTKIAVLSSDELFKPLEYNIESFDNCAACGIPAIYKCCSITYCTLNCQRKDGASHKPTHTATHK